LCQGNGNGEKELDYISPLRRWFFGAHKVVLIGVGNPIRRDDNIGVEVVAGLDREAGENTLLVESETVPEEYTDQISEFKPTHILVIDAALMSLATGSTRLIESLDAPTSAISTHFMPLQIFCAHLAQITGARIALLLIQPKDTSFGEGLTPELDLTRKRLTAELAELLREVERN
jgi:hydrogenase 3 maturation protease